MYCGIISFGEKIFDGELDGEAEGGNGEEKEDCLPVDFVEWGDVRPPDIGDFGSGFGKGVVGLSAEGDEGEFFISFFRGGSLFVDGGVVTTVSGLSTIVTL